MSLLNTILSTQGGGIVEQIAGRFGLDRATAETAVRSLLPAISQGFQKNISEENGLASLVGALQRGNHQEYIDNPESISSPETTADGNSILGHILGSKDVSRSVAADAAEKTGVSSSTLKKMLPVLASVAMGVMSKKSSETSGGKLDIGGLLGGLLNSDDDSSPVENVLNLAKKLF